MGARAPRREARERAAGRRRPRLPHRLRDHEAAPGPPRPTPTVWSARSTTWRPSRSAATPWTGARTAMRWAACSTSACRAGRRSGAPPRRRRSGRTCRRSRLRCAATRLDPVLRKALAKDREDPLPQLRRADRRRRRRARPRTRAAARRPRAAARRRHGRLLLAGGLLLAVATVAAVWRPGRR